MTIQQKIEQTIKKEKKQERTDKYVAKLLL